MGEDMRTFMFLLAALFITTNLAIADDGAAPKDKETWSLKCTHDSTKYHPFLLRLSAEYTINSDGTGELSRIRGVLLDDTDFSMLVTYDDGKAKSDPKYAPKKKKWEDHNRYVLKQTGGDKFVSGDPAELIIEKFADEVTKTKFDNHVNTGTEYHTNFHAGLEYHFSDQDGNRDEVKCSGVRYDIDRRTLS